jgi:hypothetical protein
MITQVLSILNSLVFFHLHFTWRDGRDRRYENDQYAAKVMDDDCHNKQHMQLASKHRFFDQGAAFDVLEMSPPGH